MTPERELDVLERLRRLEDRQRIADLVARYCRTLDDRDLPGLLALFCPDAGFLRPDGGGPVGHDELEAFYAGVLRTYGYSIHVPHTHVVDVIDGDTASGWVAGSAEFTVGARAARVALRYEDRYRRHDGRWRFAERRTSFWYFADADELPRLGDSRDRVRFHGPPRPADLPEGLASYAAFHADHPPTPDVPDPRDGA